MCTTRTTSCALYTFGKIPSFDAAFHSTQSLDGMQPTNGGLKHISVALHGPAWLLAPADENQLALFRDRREPLQFRVNLATKLNLSP